MESATTFVQPGTLPRPRLIGLSVRLVLGLVCCSSALFYGTHPDYLFRPGLPPLLLFVGPAFAVWVLPPVVNLGFGRSWRNRPRLVVLVLGLGATVIDLLVYEQLWAPPLAALVYGTTVYTPRSPWAELRPRDTARDTRLRNARDSGSPRTTDRPCGCGASLPRVYHAAG